MIRLYTIGFTGKSAQRFFELLEQNGVKTIIDTRISNKSQLAGFAKGSDLAFFAERIGGIGNEHILEFAPTKELLDRYRAKQMTWDEYRQAYIKLLRERDIASFDIQTLQDTCLLCSEHEPNHCHRRLLAEFLQQSDPTITIIHLQ